MKKKVLIVNTFFDEYQRTGGSPWRVPRASGPVFLAGAFNPDTTAVRVFSEQTDGFLCDLDLLGWPDLLVLTGLTSSFDRMLHLSAIAKTLNHNVITVAGGPAIRALPTLAATYFDHVCLGDIEDLRDLAGSLWGEGIMAPSGDLFPRFDLVPRRGIVGYVESSRYCNFKCAFCSLTGERRRYRKYSIDHVRRQIEATGKRIIVFLDNNFYGNDRQYFWDRIDLLGDLRRRGVIDGWSALVTGDFFAREDNMAAAARSGCIALFSGVESFSEKQLSAYNKKQSVIVPQVQMIRECLEHGILFQYGIMLDPSTRPIAELEQEVDFILSTPDITLPSYYTLPIPLLGTPYLNTCVEQGLLLPDLRLSDMQGVSLLVKPLDGVPEGIRFARDLVNLSGRRKKLLRHAARFSTRYGRRLSPLQHAITVANAGPTAFPRIATSPFRLQRPVPKRTFFGPTEPLSVAYQPPTQIDPAFAHYFLPTMVTDGAGALNPALEAGEGASHFGRPWFPARDTGTNLAPRPAIA